MAKYKPYDISQDAMVPISFKKQLVPGSLEFAINELVDRKMNISIFDSNYKNDETGCPAYDPKILLKIVLLAYSRGIIFSAEKGVRKGSSLLMAYLLKKLDLYVKKI